MPQKSEVSSPKPPRTNNLAVIAAAGFIVDVVPVGEGSGGLAVFAFIE
jgi:hypothetical protein